MTRPDRHKAIRLEGHRFVTTDTEWACECGLAGPWPRADYSLAEARDRHHLHKAALG